MPLPPKKSWEKSSVRRLSQEDGEIRRMSTTIMNLNSKAVPRAPPSTISGTEPPTWLFYHLVPTSSTHTQWRGCLLVLQLRPSVEQTWHSTWTRQEQRIASCSFLISDFALSPCSLRLARLEPPTAPRSMNPATGPSTLPLSSLNPSSVVPHQDWNLIKMSLLFKLSVYSSPIIVIEPPVPCPFAQIRNQPVEKRTAC